jgi:alpha-glucosidase (family GH31 glycosyl hydrolase)
MQLQEKFKKNIKLFLVWYALSINGNLFGEQVIPPVWWLFPNDLRCSDAKEKFMVGDIFYEIPV